jgi:hypothetical protein
MAEASTAYTRLAPACKQGLEQGQNPKSQHIHDMRDSERHLAIGHWLAEPAATKMAKCLQTDSSGSLSHTKDGPKTK